MEELAEATESAPDVLGRVLALMVAFGLLTRTADGLFAGGAEAEVLRSDHPRSLRHFCMLAAEEYQAAFGHLLHAVRTGEPAFAEALGSPLYAYLEGNPEAADTYHAAMEDLARPVGPALVEHVALDTVRTVVDIGGGRGTLAKAILNAAPAATGVCVDQPEVCRSAESELRATNPALAQRLRYEAGDFFDVLPPGADLYLLKNVLHNWSKEKSVDILACISRAMASNPTSRLLVVEPLRTRDDSTIYQSMDDLLQAVVCEQGSRTRSLEEMSDLLEAASLVATESVRLPTGHTVTVVQAKMPAGLVEELVDTTGEPGDIAAFRTL